MPTLLGLADIKAPATMDGASLAPWLNQTYVTQELRNSQKWRTSQLIEYRGLGNVCLLFSPFHVHL